MCFSLNNVSDRIRWSLDLRFQRADKNPGFYDVKSGVKMRSSSDPDFQPDWDSFVDVSRHDTHLEVMEHSSILVFKTNDEDVSCSASAFACNLFCSKNRNGSEMYNVFLNITAVNFCALESIYHDNDY